MKNIAIIVLLLLGTISTKVYGQYVTIPDTNFVTFLQTNYPQCMQGSQMDTTCTAIVSNTYLSCVGKSIADLSGIEYFDELTTLFCANNVITHIGKMPPKLVTLWAGNNNISSILTVPASLRDFDVRTNNLSSLPPMPDSLEIMNINKNNFTTLPPIPPYLKELSCSENLIDSLPPLPATLTYLWCAINNIDKIPAIPLGMINLNFNNNSVSWIPPLPATLTLLDCSDNNLDSLPTLPLGLKHLRCSSNNLSSLPALPDSLTYLVCRNNNLTQLPSLPPYLESFYCEKNDLTYLPTLPSTLRILNCSENYITSLPEIQSDSMHYLNISDNSINCMPRLKKIRTLLFVNTNITCLPNYGEVTYSDPPIVFLALCDFYNTNECPVYYNLAGQVYFDGNTNCKKDTIDTAVASVKVQLWENGQLIQQVFTDRNGFYSFDLPQNTIGTFETHVDTSSIPFAVSCPDTAFYTSVMSSTDTFFTNQDFGLVCGTTFDLGVHYINRTPGWFRPASVHSANITAGNLTQVFGMSCAVGVSGQVMVIINGPTTVMGFGGLTPTTTNGDTVIWEIPDFSTVDIDTNFIIDFRIDTLAQFGDQICFDVFVSPITGDINPANNHFSTCYQIVNSYDPNDKEVYPFSYIDTNQEWLYYTINFQNTGNAPALHITVLDTLTSNLDWGSMQLLSYSHDNYTQVLQGGIIKFNFANINLPDSTSNEPGSHGFVRYKIKLKENLPLGTVIENTAHIYFDFNAPIVTNTTINTIVLPLAQPLVTGSIFEACDGDTLTLQTAANPAYTYQWFLNGNSIPNSNTASLQVTQTGNYNVRISESILSATSDQQLVTFNGLPFVSLVFNNSPFCRDNQPADLSAYGSPTGGVYSGLGVSGSNIDVSTTGTYKVIYTFTDNNGCSDSKETIAIVDECIGVPDIETLGIFVFPNPNNGSFTLTLDVLTVGDVEFKLTNALGEVVDQRILQVQPPTQSFYISNESFATGIYFIQLQTEKSTYVERLVIE